jgi:hydrogenase maturation protease
MNQPRILVAGIGNVFKRDDGFGVEVARALSCIDLPDDVAVIDFGIRGIDLAFAITSGYEIVILVDAMQRGEEPGNVSIIQPDSAELQGSPVAVQGHNLDPLSVLRWAGRMVDVLPEVYVVGCEPAEIPGEDDLVEGLSPPVQAAVGKAVELIQNLIAQLGRATQAKGQLEQPNCQSSAAHQL